jgi:hypothetical protein
MSWKQAAATWTAFPHKPSLATLNFHRPAGRPAGRSFRYSWCYCGWAEAATNALVGRSLSNWLDHTHTHTGGHLRLWMSRVLVRLTEITWHDASLKWQHRAGGIGLTLSKYLLCCFTAICRMGKQEIRAPFSWETLLFNLHMRFWRQMEKYFDGCAIWGSHSGA